MAYFNRLSMSILLISLAALFGRGLADDCPEDYQPCTCTASLNGDLTVVCLDSTVEEIQSVFNRIDGAYIHRFDLHVSVMDSRLPADMLPGKQLGEIYIYCPRKTYQLEIDVNAFRHSAGHTALTRISGCDLAQTDFSFLSGFVNLTSLLIYGSTVTRLDSLPSLPGLVQLSITSCEGLNELDYFPELNATKLTNVYLSNNNLEDGAAAVILRAITSSPASETLKYLSLSDNRLSAVPDMLASFPKLNQLILSSGNNISLITGESLVFTNREEPVQLYLSSVGLTEIEPGALQGNFCWIYLDRNRLESVDEHVFLPILEEMDRNGFQNVLHLDANPIVCDCRLNWLIRDHRQLLRVVDGATCTNSTSFDQLSPRGFGECSAGSSTSFNRFLLLTLILSATVLAR